MNDSDLIKEAWGTRENAYAWKSGTKVGCVLETDYGRVVCGWNIEGLWMTSIHAEVCAVSKLKLPSEKIMRIAVVAETSYFTPCGACLDWLIQFAADGCKILIQGKDRTIHSYKLVDLIPYYPKK